ncbi:alpha/beta fold hydrolase [Mesorhizobium sp. M3A.F.Ca.ET.174.01.1.1]|uniref:alpha/beta fold hydrolase n=1 Tax=unclassified Mesorhizobium TaxID=325217 RepID=UPI0010936C4F|nr:MULTISPECIES: alpha/beta fold hydrolase [unclassified Mesorhizobium]TGS87439.1 alpha/beta fold hydrolase [Mesorhizobium sp. M3A.F.Ca.ET.175.01.1.1]TGT27899.1 alpha/beta fold hydrolase [Mesorhizobium sp. M3A.F.Ca.ET.174.01.1.1]
MSATRAFVSHEENYFDVGQNHRLYFRDYAGAQDATPIICLPGFWRNARDFEGLALHLSQTRRVVTPDMRGRGNSTRASDPSEYRFETLIDDVWKLADHLHMDQLVVVGTALGAFMAIQMAHDCPNRVAGIVLNDAGTETTPPGSKRLGGTVDHLERPLELLAMKLKEINSKYFPEFDDEDWRWFAKLSHRETASGQYVRDFDPMTSEETKRFRADKPSLWNEFAGLNIPIAVLKGALSDFLPQDLGERMAAANANATLTVVEGRGHPLLLTESASLAAIETLLAKVDSRGEAAA